MPFNELYTLTDGGSFWGRPVGSDRQDPPSFALLECFDYAYYGTLDLRFYASMPLLKFWPEIDKQVLREFADTVPREWPEKGQWVWKSQQTGEPILHKRKKKGAVPHDLGVPEGDPFFAVNEPGWQDTNDWKDLNSKFILMVYRDYVVTGNKDTAFLRQMWPAVRQRWFICGNSITAVEFQKMAATPIKPTIPGSCEGLALIAEACGWRRCAPPRKWRAHSTITRRPGSITDPLKKLRRHTS
jgi:hypothetical protein